MRHEFLLSFCMMVKNEEKNIGRCLNALRPLLEKADVELIIVDTGSDDSTVSIAKQYTDKLYYHKWENHFSKMRNITISYAKGEFIFILDADEVLINPLDLYETINKEKQSANTFSVKVKNLNAYGGFTIISQERIFRNDGEFHYSGAIHNKPVYKKPVMGTGIILEHYGYLFNDKELRESKFKRTGSLLKAELEKDPDNPYYRFQMAKSYGAHGDIQEALTEIRKAHKLVFRDHNLRRNLVFIYGAYALFCLQANEYDEAVRICREGLEIEPEYIDLYYVAAYSLNKTGRNDEALDAYTKYMDLVNRYDNLSIANDPRIELFFISTSFKDSALSYIANGLYDKGRFEEAYKFARQIDDKSERISISARTLLKMERPEELMDIMADDRYDRDDAEKMLSVVEAEMLNMNDGQRKRVQEVFSKGEDIYSVLNRFRLRLYEDDYNAVDRVIRDTDFERLPEFYAELFIYMDRNPRTVISAFKKMRRSKIKQYVKTMLAKRDELGDYLADYILSENVRDNDYNSQKVFAGISYVLLYKQAQVFKNIIDDSFDKYYMIFKKYMQCGINMVNLLYNGERLRLIYSTLDNEEDRFFIALKYAKEAVEKGDVKTGIGYFSEALHNNRYMACYMGRYKDELFQNAVCQEK